MKQCTKCKSYKLIDDFNFKVKLLGTRQGQCKECTRSSIRDHYRRNRIYYLNKTRKRNKIIEKEVQAYVVSYLCSHPCLDCKESDIRVLEFDHIDQNNKFMGVSALIRNRYNLDIIKKEIEKCDVRCANCHRRKTGSQLGSYKNIRP